ncbi:type I phosphomannose isomerase catalytic subunit [Geofilum rhodophaeum]|uniref:type I phosphomannose isomerase catalytic subunit n=1 Tax=Geofilum rhodophaeum TaxID=1965019 RepID=UPI000B526AA2|nr:type I phosphomannose isomerase catalytic subunit [Geofilum rhodophaeum]
MTKALYPLKFEPILMERIWGGNKLETELKKPLAGKSGIGESWELSGVDGHVSVVSNGFLKGNTLAELLEIYMGDLVGDAVFQRFGEEFPLLIKFIDAREDLSIQVHPDDELAGQRHDSFGKTEMWYVLQAEEGARLISGFAETVSRADYLKAVEEKRLESLLASHPVQAGEVFFIPAGRVHAIGAGILVAEIQQTSDVTYRIYDFDRRDAQGQTRQLHTQEALDAIDYKAYPDYRTAYEVVPNTVSPVVSCPYFTTSVLELDGPLTRDYYSLDSFVILICTEGAARLVYEGGEVAVAKGETVLIPAELRQLTFYPEGQARLLEVYVPHE